MVSGRILLPDRNHQEINMDVLKQKWHLEMHIDDDYRISDDATDCWLALVCDEGANEVFDFSDSAGMNGWQYARTLAESIVEAHNNSLK
jgi:hypothetical protein